jgi:tetratricopeptide (TPR) repeat protein
VTHYPQYLMAHYLPGQVALAKRRWDEAVQTFSTVVNLYPKCFAGQRDLGIALEQAKRPEEAAAAYQTALTMLPSNGDVQARCPFSREIILAAAPGSLIRLVTYRIMSTALTWLAS